MGPACLPVCLYVCMHIWACNSENTAYFHYKILGRHKVGLYNILVLLENDPEFFKDSFPSQDRAILMFCLQL